MGGGRALLRLPPFPLARLRAAFADAPGATSAPGALDGPAAAYPLGGEGPDSGKVLGDNEDAPAPRSTNGALHVSRAAELPAEARHALQNGSADGGSAAPAAAAAAAAAADASGAAAVSADGQAASAALRATESSLGRGVAVDASDAAGRSEAEGGAASAASAAAATGGFARGAEGQSVLLRDVHAALLRVLEGLDEGVEEAPTLAGYGAAADLAPQDVYKCAASLSHVSTRTLMQCHMCSERVYAYMLSLTHDYAVCVGWKTLSTLSPIPYAGRCWAPRGRSWCARGWARRGTWRSAARPRPRWRPCACGSMGGSARRSAWRCWRRWCTRPPTWTPCAGASGAGIVIG